MSDHDQVSAVRPTIRIQILPHPRLCPAGAQIEAQSGRRLGKILEANDIAIETACDSACACGTCHVIVRQGFETLPTALDREEDALDKAWGLTPLSRLACQVIIGTADLVIELPKYTINLVTEGR